MVGLLAVFGVFFCLLFAAFINISKNVFNSIFCLTGSFFFASFVFLVIESDFICFVSIILYIGAVVVLFLFAVLMLNEEDLNQKKPQSKQKIISVFSVVTLFFVLSFMVILKIPERVSTSSKMIERFDISDFFDSIFTDHLVSFQCIGFALLAASLGSTMASFSLKKNFLRKYQNIANQKCRSSSIKIVDVKFGKGIDYKNDSN